jgi:hypothetical protein
MKKAVIILSAAALLSCNQATKKQAETNEQATATDTLYSSPIRPNEKLLIGKMYTDTVEYIDYNADYDYAYFIVQRNKEQFMLYDGCSEGTTPDMYRGDLIKIQWQMDSSWVAGNGDRMGIVEFAKKITKTKDGNVALFRKKYTKPLKYTCTEDYSKSYLDEIYKTVEYYLANSEQELIVAHINDPATVFSYSIEEAAVNGETCIKIGISNEFENHTSIIQWIYLDGDIYEYDLPNDKLVKFDI